ncbi:MAG: hypothetical protein AB7E32_17550 [Desulfovibrio sp.]
MSQALDLLRQAMEAAQEELRLLRGGDEEGALRLARERHRLIGEGWRMRDASVEAEMRGALERLRQLHEGLLGEARRQRDKVRDELRQMRGQRKRTAAYGASRGKRDMSVSRFVDRKS